MMGIGIRAPVPAIFLKSAQTTYATPLIVVPVLPPLEDASRAAFVRQQVRIRRILTSVAPAVSCISVDKVPRPIAHAL
jgi:hypothetical protein